MRDLINGYIPGTIDDEEAWTLPEGIDRGEAVSWSAEAVARVVLDLHATGRVDGVFGLGGSAGTVIGTSAMRALPFGVPKVMVSTQASGQTRPFVGGSDIAMFYPVARPRGAEPAHQNGPGQRRPCPGGDGQGAEGPSKDRDKTRPVVAATMFGVTTPCVDRAREHLESQGVEVLVFHATGIGGQSMETLIASGQVDGVLDLTTTELADELVGGILSAGPDRLRAARRRGIPRSSASGRSTWSTSAPGRPSPIASPTACSTSTTIRSR